MTELHRREVWMGPPGSATYAEEARLLNFPGDDRVWADEYLLDDIELSEYRRRFTFLARHRESASVHALLWLLAESRARLEDGIAVPVARR